jgi:hypothetical protein
VGGVLLTWWALKTQGVVAGSRANHKRRNLAGALGRINQGCVAVTNGEKIRAAALGTQNEILSTVRKSGGENLDAGRNTAAAKESCARVNRAATKI